MHAGISCRARIASVCSCSVSVCRAGTEARTVAVLAGIMQRVFLDVTVIASVELWQGLLLLCTASTTIASCCLNCFLQSDFICDLYQYIQRIV
jgi:hypothetical protein